MNFSAAGAWYVSEATRTTWFLREFAVIKEQHLATRIINLRVFVENPAKQLLGNNGPCNSYDYLVNEPATRKKSSTFVCENKVSNGKDRERKKEKHETVDKRGTTKEG